MKVRSRPSFLRHATRALGSRLFHWAENNGVADITRNGEAWLLDGLVAHWAGPARGAGGRRLVIDAGANIGDFTAAILEAAQRRSVEVEVLAIDPAGSCVEALRRRFAGTSEVQIVQAAVGDRAGVMRLYSSAPASSQASLVRRAEGADAAGEEVPVIRLDEFLQRGEHARVSYLKLDVEGYELAALRGLGERLQPGVVEVLQFEYGGTTLDAGVTLRDFFRLLEARGYVVAKLFPQALEVRGYAPWMDHFAYANYVALPAAWRLRSPQE